VLAGAIAAMGGDAFTRWAFGHYLQIAPPPSTASGGVAARREPVAA
jgi:hypothetical protein